MDLLNVSGISRQQDGNSILKDISFTQQQFQKIAIAGETGSGKSTLMKIIAGLVQPDTGEVLLKNERVEGPAEKLIPGHRKISYLSQQFELRNNYTVKEVLSYANQLSDREAEMLYEVCRIGHLLKRRTDQVSGGERQRIAIARLLISSPSLLLLDEPYSNLDMIHKHILKSVIRDIGERLKITCMLISHDPSDTLSWADEILVMKDGHIIQKGSPQQIYSQPVDEYSAALFGKYNLVSHAAAALSGCPDTGIKKNPFVRPEDVRIVPQQNGAIAGTITDIVFMGSYRDIEVTLLNQDVITVRTGSCNFVKGEQVYIAFV